MFCLRLHQVKIMNLNHMRKFCVNQMVNGNGIINLRVKQEPIKIDTNLIHTSLHPRSEAISPIQAKIAQRVVEDERLASPTSYALMIVGAGLGLSLFFSYSVYKELFSFSRQSVYSDAVAVVTAHPEVQAVLGEGLECYGDERRTLRRPNASARHLAYEEEGAKGIRMQFHVKGSKGSGVVNLDRKGSGYEFLYVQENQSPHRTIVLQDKSGEVRELPELGTAGSRIWGAIKEGVIVRGTLY